MYNINSDKLTAAEIRVYNCVNNLCQEGKNITIEIIANSVHTSNSIVVSTAKKLGYHGAKEYFEASKINYAIQQENKKTFLQEEYNSLNQEKYFNLINDLNTFQNIAIYDKQDNFGKMLKYILKHYNKKVIIIKEKKDLELITCDILISFEPFKTKLDIPKHYINNDNNEENIFNFYTKVDDKEFITKLLELYKLILNGIK